MRPRRRTARACALALGCASIAGCYGEDAATPSASAADAATEGALGSTAKPGSVITTATFARVVDDKRGIADGLDLDGRVSGKDDAASCHQQDFTAPDGTPGIDNQFGTLLPIIEGFVGSENIGQLLAAAIANGQLLIVMSLEGVDDPVNDPEVTFHLAAGRGAPLLDTSGAYIPEQTFGIDLFAAPESTLPAHITDGTLFVGPGDAVLPVRVLDANFNLSLHGVRGRAKLTPGATGGFALSGLLAGGLRVDDFKTIMPALNVGQELIKTAIGLIGVTADLAQDEHGTCLEVSAGLQFEATPAFVLPADPDAGAPDAGDAGDPDADASTTGG